MSTSRKVYRPRTVKRHRRTKAQISEIHDAIHNVLEDDHPQSLRHVFYCIAGTLTIGKDDAGYRVIQRELLKLRRQGEIPYHWVSDGTRWRRVATSFDSPAEAVRWAARTYRRDLWRRTPVYVEVWCESDSIAGVLIEETNRYKVPLMVSRGFSSETYLYRAAEDIEGEDRPAFIYYVGDWDPSGKLIPENIEKRLRDFAPEAEIRFERLLVNPNQIHEWHLPTKPAKKKTTHARNWEGGTVEVEAVPARLARQIVREAIEQHLNLREVEVMEAAEESEREWLTAIAKSMEAAE
jgi:hypothetical protein